MKIAVLGNENSGADLLFEVLSLGQQVSVGKKNIAQTTIFDQRIFDLSQSFSPKKTSYAFLQSTYIDMLSGIPFEEIRNMDVLVFVIRSWPTYPEEKIDPFALYEDFMTSLQIRDLDILDRFCTRNAKDLSKKKEMDWARLLFECVENDKKLDCAGQLALEWSQHLGLVTSIPRFAIIDMNEKQWEDDTLLLSMKEKFSGDEFMKVCLAVEKDISLMDPENRQEMLDLYQIDEPVIEKFLKQILKHLGWISFFTVGEDEVKAWMIKEGATAMEAAGKIHSDIQRGFIRAEVVHYEDFKLQHYSFKKCKEAGCFAVEGKQYIVQDGDIVHFRFNI